ncbi:MAG: hypothetical protein ACREDL_21085, partial [Bradyrhizobium sp.]
LLQAWHFTSGHHFAFGARSRDLGYWPRRRENIVQWFNAGFSLTRRVIADGPAVVPEVRRVVAKRCRGLWTKAGMYDALEEISCAMSEQGHWSEGWIAARQTLRDDHEAFSADVMQRLRALEVFLRPRGLVEKIRSVVLRQGISILDFDSFDLDAERAEEQRGGYQRMDGIVQALGEATARDDTALRELLPELLSGRGRLRDFGHGLATACAAPEELWHRLITQLGLAPENDRNTQVLGGFLTGLNTRDSALVGALLDEAVEHETLGPLLPVLQISVLIDANGIARLTRALAAERAPVDSFRSVAYGRASDPIPGDRLRGLLTVIAAKPRGHDVAMEILSMRLHSDHADDRPADPDLGAAGRALLAQLPFSHDDRDGGYRLQLVAKAALTGAEGAETARLVWVNFVAAVARREAHAFEQQALVKALFSTQPAALLNEITSSDDKTTREMLLLLRHTGQVDGNPVDAIPHETLLAWCRAEPATRFLRAAAIITPVTGGGDGAAARWTPAAEAFLEEAPDRVAILDKFVEQFRPGGWGGSLAAILDSRAALLLALGEHHDRHLAVHAMRAYEKLQLQIEAERQWETREHRSRDERFE